MGREHVVVPGEQAGIRSRVAVFAGAALGGVYWGAVSLIVLTHRQSGDPFLSRQLLRLAATSVVVLCAGIGLMAVSRPNLRTAGVGLIVCALSGWIVFGTVALQSWLWRL